MTNIEQVIEQYPDESFITLTGYDEAIVGISSDIRLVYDSEAIIDILARGMSREDAIEFYEYNVEGSYFGEKSPILMTPKKKII